MGIQKWAVGALSALALATASHAAGFVNGGFEDGTTNGWTEGGALTAPSRANGPA